MGRIILKHNSRPLIQGFVCPVTQRDTLKYTGCEAKNAVFTGIQRSAYFIQGKFRCACGKNFTSRIMHTDGEELTFEKYERDMAPVVEPVHKAALREKE